jgi:hypothetical protein
MDSKRNTCPKHTTTTVKVARLLKTPKQNRLTKWKKQKAEIPAREKTCLSFYDTPEGRGTPERMAILNKYRDAVANGEEIPYENQRG